MADYRDPKVTNSGSSGSKMKWVWIALAVILGLLLLSWLIGAFDETAENETIEPAVVVDEPGALETEAVDGVIVEPESGEAEVLEPEPVQQ